MATGAWFAGWLALAPCYLPPLGAGAPPDGAEAGALPAAGGAPAGAAFLSTALVPEWPRKSRVGANSPNLWPTMFSVTYTGMNLFPLCTANVCPTKSGVTVLARDHVFITRFSFRWFMPRTFFISAG